MRLVEPLDAEFRADRVTQLRAVFGQRDDAAALDLGELSDMTGL
jgi:hypothetical protein